MTRSIIFDFDGTLAIGRGPVVAYARELASVARGGFVARVEEALSSFDAGQSDYLDGYQVVAELAARDGVSSGTMSKAYLASREMLGTAEAPVNAPAGLAELLRTLSEHATIHVATNAPATGVERVFDTWGVGDFIDHLHVNVGKPEGLYPIIRDALATGPVMAVGDIVANDLQPALDLGADTALVGATAVTSGADVTMRGASLTDLHDALVSWAQREPRPIAKGTHHHA